MKEIILSVLIIGLVLVSTFGVLAEENASPTDIESGNDTPEVSCKNLYFYDNTIRECGYKKFCGTYMYEGLRTFETIKECQDDVKEVILAKDLEFCGKSSEFKCTANDDCRVAGCSNEICMGVLEEDIVTTCIYTECYNNKGYNCGCYDGKCSWKKTSDFKEKTKILPETASARAKERLGELGFTITLKEVGQNKSVYVAEAEKEGKFLGMFKTKAKVSAEIDSETGEVIKTYKPWWGFLAGI